MLGSGKYILLFLGYNDLDPWEELSGGDFADSVAKYLLSIGADWYSVVFIIGVVGLVLSFLCMAISLMFKRKGSDIAIAKEAFMTKIIIAIIIFSFPTLFGILYPIFESLGSL